MERASEVRCKPERRKLNFPLIFLLCVIYFISLTSAGFVFDPNNVPLEVSKTELAEGSGCEDANGAPQSHQDSWTSAVNACDHVMCWEGTLRNYTILSQCKQLGVQENPDPSNCHEVSNSSLAWPDCCPSLQCAANNYVAPTTAPCDDGGDTDACVIWKDHFQACDENNVTIPILYNITSVYCNKTCGFC